MWTEQYNQNEFLKELKYITYKLQRENFYKLAKFCPVASYF